MAIATGRDLLNALMSRDLAGVMRAVQTGANVNQSVKNAFGQPLFPVCAAVGEPQILQFVLEKGANPNVRDQTGSPLELAIATFEDASQVAMLIAHGADVNGRDEDGYTPLMVATGNNRIAALLVQQGADINAVTASGWSVLMAAAVHGDVRLIEGLLRAGASVNHRDQDRRSALQHAVLNRRTDNAEVLKRYGATN